MPRSRNIKHSFFSNDELADIEPLGRILFIGMWTIADYKGDFEWREKRIKAQLLPYDNCNIKKIAINLDQSGFIRFYSDGDKIYVNVHNFSKHQNPHKNEKEKGSVVPAYNESMRQAIDLKGLTINHDKSGLKPEDSTSDPADSCFLKPDSCSLIPEIKEKAKAKRFVPVYSDWNNWDWPTQPDEDVFDSWLAARKKIKGGISELSFKRLGKEFCKATNLNDCLAEMELRGWKGFKSDWMQNNSGVSNGQHQQHSRSMSAVDKVREATEQWAKDRSAGSEAGRSDDSVVATYDGDIRS